MNIMGLRNIHNSQIQSKIRIQKNGVNIYIVLVVEGKNQEEELILQTAKGERRNFVSVKIPVELLLRIGYSKIEFKGF